jgi:putative flavoprotein involved in K+ transport
MLRSYMTTEKIETLIIGGGQAGLAMSEHLSKRGLPHLILERHRIAERWRSERWDSLVANGPAWHDRFPSLEFSELSPDSFATRDRIVDYFETFAQQIGAPIRCGVEVKSVEKRGDHFIVETSDDTIQAKNVVAATGPFQRPLVPRIIPQVIPILQLHSNTYKNPTQLPEGAVLVVGAGSSGGQIADELLRNGRQVYLSVSAHDRPPIRYRGKDFCWWLGVLGQWDAKTRAPGMEHVTISISGARGGQTVDYRNFAARGMALMGRVNACNNGILEIADDLAHNMHTGDKYYLAVLDSADAYAAKNGLDLPEEPSARLIAADPDCVTTPIRELNLAAAGITSIIWATGYAVDFNWLKAGTFDATGRPHHDRGVSIVKGLYVLGLPWLSCRASPFIWGVWRDAQYLAEQIALRRD